MRTRISFGKAAIILLLLMALAFALGALSALAFPASAAAAVSEMDGPGAALKRTTVYDRPSAKGKVLARVNKGDALEVLYCEDGFAVVANDKGIEGEGYVPLDATRFALAQPIQNRWYFDEPTYLYTQPNTSKQYRAIDMSGEAGQELFITAREGSWWKVTADGTVYYLQGKHYNPGTRPVTLINTERINMTVNYPGAHSIDANDGYGRGEGEIADYDSMNDTLADVNEQAHVIVLGTILKQTPTADALRSTYTVQVDEMIRGNDVKKFNFIATTDMYEVGKQYALFLNKADHVYWTSMLIMPTDMTSRFEIANGRVIAPKWFRDIDRSAAGFLKSVRALKPSKRLQQPTAVTEQLSGQALIDASAYVFTGRVTSVDYPTSVAAGTCQVEFIRHYKGRYDRLEQTTVRVPQGVQKGKTYLFFRDEEKDIVARKGCELEQGTAACDEMIALLGGA